jgi:hypothetical protein
MMNPMNPGGLTDDELLRLARLLQQTRGEGLAFINPGEAQMLKDAGGSGEPIPGTQGFGVGGGPIRSYSDPELESSATSNTMPSSYSGGGGDPSINNPGYDPEVSENLNVNRGRDNRPSAPQGGKESDARYQAPPPPPKYYDKLGREHSSPGARDAANQRIDEQRSQLQQSFTDLTTDADYEFLKSQGQLPSFADLPESEVQAEFNKKKEVAYQEARLQTKNYTDLVTTTLRSLDQSALEGLTFEMVADQIANYLPEGATNRLSENTRREVLDSMGRLALREARFNLTPEEVDAFARQAIQAEPVADAVRPEIEQVAPAEQVAVGEVGTPDRVVIDQIGELNRDLIDNVVEGEKQLSDYLMQRIRGEATSPAELQLKRATEQNLRSLLGASAGTADPAKLRQIRNIYSETAQVLSGQAAELRSREQIDAENRLVQIYKQQGDRELQVAMVNLETKRQEAFKQADLDQVRNLSIQQANLQRVITKASLDRDVELANLDTRRSRALSQGKIDVAVALANLEKDITLSKLDAELALRSRALDDALALANYQGQMALEGIEVKIELAEMEADVRQELARLGIDSAEKIAQLNADTQLAIANLNASAARYAADSEERAAIIGAVGTIVAGVISSDYRLKTDINKLQEEESLSMEQIDELLTILTPYTFQYKDQTYGTGKRFGIMAQDLEKSDVGKQFVIDTPVGKMVDFGNMMGLIVASQAYLHECSVR